MVEFVRNSWFAIASSGEVISKPLARTVFGRQAVVFRSSTGTPVVLDNRCPHKFAPLSMGRVVDDTIECPYHGLRYAPDGRCVHVPGQAVIPPGARVQSYPSVEHCGLIWFWPGDPARAARTSLPEFRHFGEPGWTVFHGPCLDFPTNIWNVLDNLVDPAHTSFVHQSTIGGAQAADVPLVTEQNGDTITTGRWIENSEPVPVMRRFGGFKGNVDRWQFYHLHAPNISLVDMGAIDAGSDRSETGRNRSYRTFSYAALTPETARSTHYFWLVIRNFAAGDSAVSEEMAAAYARTFDEDRDLLREIEHLQSAHETRPLRLAIDNATTRMRRLIRRKMEDERASGGHGLVTKDGEAHVPSSSPTV
jgi:phenylpropionate dioxygenase-like ring-hydroxylating dioxygenase large terminal subunit